MDIHENAGLAPLGREHLVKTVLGGQTPKTVGEAVGVCRRTMHKWVKRFEQKGHARCARSAGVCINIASVEINRMRTTTPSLPQYLLDAGS